MEKTRNLLTISIVTALAAGALASAGAVAHDVPDAKASSTAASDTSTTGTAATMGTNRTMDASSAASETSSTAADTNTAADTSAATKSLQSSGTPDTASSDYDQLRANSTGSSASTQANKNDDVVWFVVPVALENQGNQLSKGCWVRLYSGDNFDGRYVSIVGPTGIRELRSPYGTGLNNWESAMVGPNATVTTYDDEDFRARNATLRAGQRYPDLDDSKLGLFDDIESIRVTCNNASGSGNGM